MFVAWIFIALFFVAMFLLLLLKVINSPKYYLDSEAYTSVAEQPKNTFFHDKDMDRYRYIKCPPLGPSLPWGFQFCYDDYGRPDAEHSDKYSFEGILAYSDIAKWRHDYKNTISMLSKSYWFPMFDMYKALTAEQVDGKSFIDIENDTIAYWLIDRLREMISTLRYANENQILAFLPFAVKYANNVYGQISAAYKYMLECLGSEGSAKKDSTQIRQYTFEQYTGVISHRGYRKGILSSIRDEEMAKKLYKWLLLRYHPDNVETGDVETFRVVQQEYKEKTR